MTKTRGAIYASTAALLLCLGYCGRHKHDVTVDAAIKAPVLKPTEQAKVIVDTRRHTITTVTRRADGRTETKATFLPSSGASVSVGMDRNVLVTSRSWVAHLAAISACGRLWD